VQFLFEQTLVANVEPLSALIELEYLDPTIAPVLDVSALAGLRNLVMLDMTDTDVLPDQAIRRRFSFRPQGPEREGSTAEINGALPSDRGNG
jgi:hypothetical protein